MRILDIGPTSPTNINFLTTLGHGVYMADVVNEALRDNRTSVPDENGVTHFDVEGLLDNNLDFAGREFDVVLLWTTLDYIPQDLVGPMIKRLRSCLRPGGRVLTFFHTKNTGPDTSFCRYHVTDTDSIEARKPLAMRCNVSIPIEPSKSSSRPTPIPSFSWPKTTSTK